MREVTASPRVGAGRGLRLLSVSSTAELWGAELALATYLRYRPEGVRVRVLCLSENFISFRRTA